MSATPEPAPVRRAGPGRPARWGKRHSRGMKFPVVLYDRLAEEASNAGMGVTEYVTLVLAPIHGVDLPGPNPFLKRSVEPDDPNQPALPLGA